jgi:hypothetical protein
VRGQPDNKEITEPMEQMVTQDQQDQQELTEQMVMTGQPVARALLAREVAQRDPRGLQESTERTEVPVPQEQSALMVYRVIRDQPDRQEIWVIQEQPALAEDQPDLREMMEPPGQQVQQALRVLME